MLDSGLLYRGAALAVCAAGLETGTARESELRQAVAAMNFRVESASGSTRLLLDGRECTSEARSEEMAGIASKLAAIGEIRALLLPYQRGCVQPPGLVADGRDMGTVVFPGAEVKIFLQASTEVRAARRHKQLKNMGIAANIHQLDEVIRNRDSNDSSRAVAPMAIAPDAIVIDTTDMDKGQVALAVAQVVTGKLALPMPDPSFYAEL